MIRTRCKVSAKCISIVSVSTKHILKYTGGTGIFCYKHSNEVPSGTRKQLKCTTTEKWTYERFLVFIYKLLFYGLSKLSYNKNDKIAFNKDLAVSSSSNAMRIY